MKSLRLLLAALALLTGLAHAQGWPYVKERLAQAALVPVGNTPQQFAAVMRADIETWSKLARELKLEPQ